MGLLGSLAGLNAARLRRLIVTEARLEIETGHRLSSRTPQLKPRWEVALEARLQRRGHSRAAAPRARLAHESVVTRDGPHPTVSVAAKGASLYWVASPLCR